MGDKPICLTSHVLYDLCVDKNITVFEFLQKKMGASGLVGGCRLFSSTAGWIW